MALRFFAAGSYQNDVGSNINAAVSQPTVSCVIEEVVHAMCAPEVFDKYVRFPQNLNELDAIARRYVNQN